jgi:hypothetical protein
MLMFHGFFAASNGAVVEHRLGIFWRRLKRLTFINPYTLFLTGVRAVFAPLFGVWVYERFGFTLAFSLAIFLIVAGIVVLVWSYKKNRSNKSDDQHVF